MASNFPLCGNCAHVFESITEEPCKSCHDAFLKNLTKPNFKSKITRIDTIRSKSVNQMAGFLSKISSCPCVAKSEMCSSKRKTSCESAWEAWLSEGGEV